MKRLAAAYPRGHPARPLPTKRDPLEELIFTVLSQNTSDVNRDRAWASMRRAFPRWEDVLGARASDLERAIATGGLAATKAPRIQAILREVLEREGDLSLARLKRRSDHDVAEYLRSLPGIGPKTVACVLAFALGRPALPVDTHVHRVAGRLRLFARGTSAERAQAELEELVAPEDRVTTHLALIAHGRTTCTAQRPACTRCLLADICPSVGLGS